MTVKKTRVLRWTGSDDATQEIQDELDLAGDSGGGEVYLPPGRYPIQESLTVPSGVTLAGSWQAPHHAEGLLGTVLEAYAGRKQEDGPALIEMKPSSLVRGMTIFYPEQTIPGTVAYPPSIRGRGMHATLIDLTLVNPYFAIDLTARHELHHMRNIYGCPLNTGIAIDGCTDIGRVENVHFNPHYWDRSGAENLPDWQELLAYIWEHSVAFTIARSDWEYHLNTFSYGCRIGYRFTKSEHGACNGNFLGVAADWARRALLVESTQRPGLLITNGEWVGGEGSEAMMEVADGFDGVVQFSNNSFWGPAQRVALVAGRGVVNFSQCNFCNWDHDGKGLPAVEARGGALLVRGSCFWEDKPQVVLRKGVDSAVITGNVFKGSPRLLDEGATKSQIGLNATM